MRRILAAGVLALVIACARTPVRDPVGTCRTGLTPDGTVQLIRGRESADPQRDRALIVEVRERRGGHSQPLPGASVRLYAPQQGPPHVPVLVAQTHEAGRARFHVPHTATFAVRVSGLAHRGAVAELSLRSDVQDTLRVELQYHLCPIE